MADSDAHPTVTAGTSATNPPGSTVGSISGAGSVGSVVSETTSCLPELSVFGSPTDTLAVSELQADNNATNKNR